MKLLIIEDEPDLLASLARGFRKKGYAVDTAEDGTDGLELFLINEYDLILLDLNLPSLDGLEVLKEIRKENQTQRVLILSARSSVPDRVVGLDTGANDYLPKPFDFLELDARVRTLLRSALILNDAEIDLGCVRVNTSKKQVFSMQQDPLDLAPREYAIIEYLTIHRGRVVSAEELIEHVWDSEVNLFSDAVKVHISNIRRKLVAVCGEQLIDTVRGHGYLIEGEKIQK